MTISEMQETSKEIMSSLDYHASYTFAKQLEQSLIQNNVQETNPEAFKSITGIIFPLYVFSIAYVNSEILERIFVYNTKEAFAFQSENWDIFEELEKRFYINFSLDPKKDLTLTCLPLLQKCLQIVGTIKLNISTEKPNADPSIQNWLEYYDRKTGFESTSPIERSKFFSTDDSVLQLTPDERSLLRSILTFYDYLRTDGLVSVDKSLFEFDDSQNNSIQSNYTAPKAEKPQIASPQPLHRGKTVDLRNLPHK